MTIQAIKTRLTDEIPEIDEVYANTGMEGQGGGGMSPSFPGHESDDGGDDEGPQAPF